MHICVNSAYASVQSRSGPKPHVTLALYYCCTVTQLVEVDAIIGALREHLQGTHKHPYTVLGQFHLLGLSAALTIGGLDLLASVGGIVNYFLQGRLGSHNMPVVAGRCCGIARADRVCTALLLLMNYLWFMYAQFFSHLGNYMLLCLHQTLTL